MSSFILVELIQAQSLMPGNFSGGSDPYVLLQIGNITARSHTVEDTLNPKWNQVFNFQTDLGKPLTLTVMNQNILRPDENLGQVEVIFAPEPWETVRFKEKLKNVEKGSIEFTVRYIPLFDEESDHFRDLFGFDFGLVSDITRHEYEDALFGCQKFDTVANFEPPLWRNVPRTAQEGIGFIYKATVWEWIALSKIGSGYSSPEILKLMGPSFYSHLLERQGNEVAIDQIDRDVYRTFSLHHCFSFKEGRDMLARVLRTLAVYLPHIGYCQGMNSLVAYLIMVTTEEKAFRLSVMLLQYLLGSAYHVSGLTGVQVDQLIVEDCLAELLPQLAVHFAHYGVSISLITTEWFLTLFAGAFPFHTTLRVWDLIFCYGIDAIICTAFALLRIHEDHLLSIHDFEQIKDYVYRKTRLLFNESLLVPLILEMLSKKDWTTLRKNATSSLIQRQAEFDWFIKKQTNLSLTQIEKLRKQFGHVAFHGVVTPALFPQLFEEPLNSLVTDPKMGQNFWNHFDKSKTHTIEFKQYCVGIAPLITGGPEDRLRFCFQVCDFDDDGRLNDQEIKTILAWQYRSLGNNFNEGTLEEDLSLIFMSKDEKLLSIEEFVEYFKSKPLCFLLSVSLEDLPA
jgi:Ca2+-binding EF-hand superfamily protein